MMAAAQGLGAQHRAGAVTGLVRSRDESAVRGVTLDERVIEADAVVIAMGPWSVLAAQWMALPAVYGLQSPSLVYDTGNDVPAQALFLEDHDEDGEAVSIEMFPRGDGTTHVTAFSDQRPLPIDPAAVTPDPRAIDRLQALLRADFTGTPHRADRGAAILLPPGHAGRPAADRPRARQPQAPMSPPATACGESSTRPQPAKRWPN